MYDPDKDNARKITYLGDWGYKDKKDVNLNFKSVMEEVEGEEP
jgi:hypothetical protein